MRRLRTLTHPTELVRIAWMVAIWIGLHLYASRPLLVAAAAGGIAPLVAWSVVLLAPFITVLPLVSRRSIAQNIGYAAMSIFAMLLVLVLMSDVLRVSLLVFRVAISSRAISFVTIGLAGVLAQIG